MTLAHNFFLIHSHLNEHLLVSRFFFFFFTNKAECRAPHFGVLFLWAVCSEKRLLALRNCFQSDGTKEIAYCYLRCISLATSDSKLFFRYLLPCWFFPNELFFLYPLPYFC